MPVPREQIHALFRGELIVFFSLIGIKQSAAQELLKAIEPGTGYSRMKQWAIEKGLLFENFTKDSLVIVGGFKDTGSREYRIKLLSKFCAGDDYAGRLFQATLQEFIKLENENTEDAFSKERRYIDALAGKSAEDGRFEGDYKVRRERLDQLKGLAVGRTSEKGSWEVGLFVQQNFLLVQTNRNNDRLCK